VTINKNLFSGIFFLALGLFVLISIPGQIAESSMQYGPRLFPQLVSVLMIVCSLYILYQELTSRKKKIINDKSINKETNDEKYWHVDSKELYKTGIVFVIMSAYIFILDKIGFIISSLLFVLISLVFYKTKKWLYYMIVIILTIVIYFIFTYLLKIQLP